MKVQNYMELVVDHVLEKLLEKEVPASRFTDKDLLDIKALALNNLPPQYTVSDKGGIFVKVKEQLVIQFQADVIRALLQAMEKVGNNPRE